MNLWLHRFAILIVAATFVLILAGGNVTSKGAGLAVPDWPTSFGSFNPHGWTSMPLVRDEHSHRLIGAFIGLLVVCMVIWLWRSEPREHVRLLGYVLLGAVVLQGLLGGLRVVLATFWHLDISIWFAVVHACFAQAFFCLAISMAMITSPHWPIARPDVFYPKDRQLRPWTSILALAVYGQLILGAILRHTGMGHVGILHIAGALVIGGLMVQAANYTMPRPPDDRLSRITVALFLLYGLQIVLGIMSYMLVLGMNGRNPDALLQTYLPTAHVATGALILGVSFALALRSFAITSHSVNSALSTQHSVLRTEVPA